MTKPEDDEAGLCGKIALHVLPETSASDQINKVVHDIWVALSLWARETIDGYFSARIRDFLLAPKFTPDFFQAVSGVERGQDDHAGQDV